MIDVYDYITNQRGWYSILWIHETNEIAPRGPRRPPIQRDVPALIGRRGGTNFEHGPAEDFEYHKQQVQHDYWNRDTMAVNNKLDWMEQRYRDGEIKVIHSSDNIWCGLKHFLLNGTEYIKAPRRV